MANALTLTAAALPSAVAGTTNPFNVAPGAFRSGYTFSQVTGLKSGGEANGFNSAAYTYTLVGVPGVGDTIANAELLKGVEAGSRLAALLTISYATQADLDATLAAMGFMASANGGSALRLITAAPGVPTATITTAAATGSLRISIAASNVA